MFKLIPAWALALLFALPLQAQAAVEVRGIKFADTTTVALAAGPPSKPCAAAPMGRAAASSQAPSRRKGAEVRGEAVDGIGRGNGEAGGVSHGGRPKFLGRPCAAAFEYKSALFFCLAAPEQVTVPSQSGINCVQPHREQLRPAWRCAWDRSWSARCCPGLSA